MDIVNVMLSVGQFLIKGTHLPTSSTTGAGHSKNVFSTPAGFSSEREKMF